MATRGDVVKPQSRLVALDGLRGVAAFVVVCHHFFCAFLPWLIPSVSDHPFWLADTPVGILFNGQFAVSIFFVLSGFVVARAASKSGDPLYINVPLRYLRLALPATLSVIFAWGLLTLMPTAASHLNEIHPSSWLSGTWQQPIPSFFNALATGFFREFRIRPVLFNNVLWTMKYELIGSVAIYLFYGLIKGRARTVVAVLILIASIYNARYTCFVLGAWMMEAWYAGKLKRLPPWLALCGGILLGFPDAGFDKRMGIPNIPHTYNLLSLGETGSLIAPVAAALILYAVLNSQPLHKLLSNRLARYLGKVSFPLYLVHVPLLYTVFSSLYLWAWPASNLILLALFATFLGASLILATAGEALVDKPVLDGIHWAKERYRTRGQLQSG